MKDFNLPRRDFEIKLWKYGLMALILIRTVHFKPVFSSRSSHIVGIGFESIAGIVI